MTLLWAVPPLVIAIGAAFALVQLRGIADAAADLRRELKRFDEVRLAVAEVRAASADARLSYRSMRGA